MLVVAAVVAGAAVLAIKLSTSTRSTYSGPLACPLVPSQQINDLALRYDATLVAGRGFESDLDQTWTVKRRSFSRSRRTVTRSRKIGQQCLWIVAPRRHPDQRKTVVVDLTDIARVKGSWRTAPDAAAPIAGVEGLQRPAVGWKEERVLASIERGEQIDACTVAQQVGPRYLQVSLSGTAIDCRDALSLAATAGDALARSSEKSATS